MFGASRRCSLTRLSRRCCDDWAGPTSPCEIEQFLLELGAGFRLRPDERASTRTRRAVDRAQFRSLLKFSGGPDLCSPSTGRSVSPTRLLAAATPPLLRRRCSRRVRVLELGA